MSETNLLTLVHHTEFVTVKRRTNDTFENYARG